MNYQRIYDEFIKDRRIKELTISGYTEKHHIIPRSHGGDNSKGNLIKLSAQDHYFAHELLAKIHGGGMWSALFIMSKYRSRSARFAKINRSMYEKSKIESAKESSKRMIGKGNHFYGKTHTKEARRKIVENRIQVTGKDHHEYNPKSILWG